MGPMAHALVGAQAGQKGVYVRRVEPTSPAGALLKRGDIVLAFDGTDIANDGTVPFRSGERISFSYLVSKKYVGDEVRACRGARCDPPCATDRSWRPGSAVVFGHRCLHLSLGALSSSPGKQRAACSMMFCKSPGSCVAD